MLLSLEFESCYDQKVFLLDFVFLTLFSLVHNIRIAMLYLNQVCRSYLA